MTGVAAKPVAEDALTPDGFAHLARPRLAPEIWEFL
jgi:hypothetical protein